MDRRSERFRRAAAGVLLGWSLLTNDTHAQPPRAVRSEGQAAPATGVIVPLTCQPGELDPRTVQACRALPQQARLSMGRGDHAGAAELFDAAYRLLPDPDLLFNAAVAHLFAAHCSSARQRLGVYARSGFELNERWGPVNLELARRCPTAGPAPARPPGPRASSASPQSLSSEGFSGPARGTSGGLTIVAGGASHRAGSSAIRPPPDGELSATMWARWGVTAAAALATGATAYYGLRARAHQERRDGLEAGAGYNAAQAELEAANRRVLGWGVAAGVLTFVGGTWWLARGFKRLDNSSESKTSASRTGFRTHLWVESASGSLSSAVQTGSGLGLSVEGDF